MLHDYGTRLPITILAACTAEVSPGSCFMPAYRPRSPTQALTYPIDFTKTRLQLAGEGVPVRLLAHEWAARPRGGVQGASRSSLSSALKGVLRLEGWRGYRHMHTHAHARTQARTS
jgi:hypothetical protein